MAHQGGNTFAHSMINAAVGRVANGAEDVSNFDRLAVIAGSALEETEGLAAEVQNGNKETHRLLNEILKATKNGNGYNGSRRFREKARSAVLPFIGGTSGVALLIYIRDILTALGA
jgi:hypothetical protein